MPATGGFSPATAEALNVPRFLVHLSGNGTPVTGTGTSAWSDVASSAGPDSLNNIQYDTHGVMSLPDGGGGAAVCTIPPEWVGLWIFGARIHTLSSGWAADDFMIPAIIKDNASSFPATPQYWGDYLTNKTTIITLAGYVITPAFDVSAGERVKPMWFHDAAGSGLTMDAVTGGVGLTTFWGFFSGPNLRGFL